MRRHNNLASQFHLENHLVRYPDELHRHYILADAGETQVFDAQGWNDGMSREMGHPSARGLCQG
jgi:hypothetical protein